MIRVPAAYLLYAHEAAAEDGHAPAKALMRRWDAHPKRRGGFPVGRVEVPTDAVDEIRELRSVAEIYAIQEPDDDPAMRRAARDVLDQIRNLGGAK